MNAARTIANTHKETIRKEATRCLIMVRFDHMPSEISDMLGNLGKSIRSMNETGICDYLSIQYLTRSNSWRIFYEILAHDKCVADCYSLVEDEVVEFLSYLVSRSVPLVNEKFRPLYNHANQQETTIQFRPIVMLSDGL
ncbi:Hypothetical protein HVR_LOCUS439 [uncultured virus]|nr:Hypothetical protein HVR_LOCUS439 [uncultured virus]